MPRHSTFPTLYDECKTICVSSLKKWGYLKPGEWKNGTVSWSRNGTQTSSIGIVIDMFAVSPYIELNYKCDEEHISYQVQLVAIPSNLGKGNVWYFLCPITRKRCRKLYLVGGRFLHRGAFKGCYYEKQTYSSRNRSLCKLFEISFGSDKAYEQIYSKYFKTHYAGKPTKKYFKLLEKIRRADGVSERAIEEMIYRK